MTIVDRIKDLCISKDTNIAALERELNLSKGSVSKWTKSTPNSEALRKIADYFRVSIDFLMGREDQMNELNEQDRKDIAKSLEKIMNQFDSEGDLLAYGGKIDPQDRDIYKTAINSALEMIKIRNKQK